MYENLNELIDINLKLIFDEESKSLFRNEFKDENGRDIHNSERIAEIMDRKGLIELEASKRYRCDLTEFGHEVISAGGWLEYLRFSRKLEEQELQASKRKEQLELELTKSNIEANELNKRIAEQNTKNEKKNRIAMWVNIIIGVINVGLLLWQIMDGK